MQHARDDVFVLDMFRFEDLEMNNTLLNRSQEERFAINVQVCGGKTIDLSWYTCMYNYTKHLLSGQNYCIINEFMFFENNAC